MNDNLPTSDPRAVRHSERFRKVSTRYPRRVAEAYGGDLDRAAGDSDEQVAATVATWERRQGLSPRDWSAIGAEERDEADDEIGVRGRALLDSDQMPAPSVWYRAGYDDGRASCGTERGVIVRYNPDQSASTVLTYEGSGPAQRLVLVFGPRTDDAPIDRVLWWALRNEVATPLGDEDPRSR